MCSIDGCADRAKALGLCLKHYTRQRRHGNPAYYKKRPGPTPIPAEERFWAQVNKTDGCWFWTGAVSSRGYGNFGRGRKHYGQVRAHRFSWEIHFGPTPAGMLVCHHCDNPLCVRPDHLFIGTSADNSRDMREKGRSGGPPTGEDHFGSKLTRANVIAIRERHAPYSRIHGARALAKEFGVCHEAIRKVLRGETWRCVA